MAGMSMGMSTMAGMSTTSSSMTGMSMPTGSPSSSMDGMPMYMTSAGSMMMSMQSMMMVFFTATDTPLYSMAWTPDTTGQYAGTCIFLIVLAIIFRMLIAVRSNLSAITGAYVRSRETGILRRPSDPAARRRPRPWRLNDALVWASIDTTIAGVSYLLMLAVMTMNVGYFLSILGGTFAGSFMVGRWTGPTGH